MKKTLLLLLPLLLFYTNANTARPKIAVFIQTSFTSSEERLECVREALKRGGWDVDWYNADARTWGAGGTSDDDWFSDRYAAVLIANFSSNGSIITMTNGGYGQNFQNAAGLARTAFGPFGGRWRIPVYAIVENITPSTTFDDTTANNYVAGITHTTPAGSFSKASVTAANGGTWRYRLLGKLTATGERDTFWSDQEHFSCRPNPWLGAGTVAAILYADTTNGLGACAGSDTVMSAWRYRPRGDKAGITYYQYSGQVIQHNCIGIMLALQAISAQTRAKPNVVARINIVEHNSCRGIDLNSATITNYVNFYRKMQELGVPLQLAPVMPGDFGGLGSGVIDEARKGLNSGLFRWEAFGGFQFFAAGGSDTGNVRQLWMSNENCIAQKDTMGFPSNKYTSNDIISSQGIVGMYQTKVLTDNKVRVITSTLDNVHNGGSNNWVVAIPAVTRNIASLNPHIVPDGSGRIIYARPTVGLGDFETFTTRVASNGGATIYLGSWVRTTLTDAYTKQCSIFWHGNTNFGADPYHSWLFGDLFIKHFNYFDQIMKFDNVSAQVFTPRPN